MGAEQADDKNKVEDDPDKKSRGRECCKRALKFLFSHIGLCGMVIAYSVAGGFIFKHLEQTNEKEECLKQQREYVPAENDTMNKLWEISRTFRQDSDERYALDAFQTILETFRGHVLDLGYNGEDCKKMGKSGGPDYQWTFPSALLFSVTVITTIGYGNIAPKTFWGRLVCIAYAVLGIPLMLLCLANIGDVLADVFRFVYTKICCCGCCRRKDKNKVESLQQKGRKSPEAWKEQYNKNQKGGGGVVDDDEDDEDEEEEDEKISVPLTITMTIITVYIIFGAAIFRYWETEWNMMTACYFCFVTISTIGFGDLVPGSAQFGGASDTWKMVFTAVYMLFGMAILSMCFSLIQEEIVAKFRWVGEKLGIIEKEKPEDEEDEEEEEETPRPTPQAAAAKRAAPPYARGYPPAASPNIPRKTTPPVNHMLPPKKM